MMIVLRKVVRVDPASPCVSHVDLTSCEYSLLLPALSLSGLRHSPLAILTPGFLLNSAMFRSYAEHLASYGWAVLMWDMLDLLDDIFTVAYMQQVCVSVICTTWVK